MGFIGHNKPEMILWPSVEPAAHCLNTGDNYGRIEAGVIFGHLLLSFDAGGLANLVYRLVNQLLAMGQNQRALGLNDSSSISEL
jgi:hypothetical protein